MLLIFPIRKALGPLPKIAEKIPGSSLSLPRKRGLVKPSIQISRIGLGGYIYEAHFECHDILMLGKNPIKWRHRPDMTIAVDWDVKHRFG